MKASLRPPFKSSQFLERGNLPFHNNNPTHGCTFQPNSNVTFPRSASWPVISVIWYFGLTFFKLIFPGGAFFFGGGGVFEDLREVGLVVEEEERPRREVRVSGLACNGELIIWSQIIAWEGGEEGFFDG